MTVTVTSGLSVALAVFIGVEAAVLAFTVWPLTESRRMHVALVGIAAVALFALSLLSGSG